MDPQRLVCFWVNDRKTHWTFDPSFDEKGSPQWPWDKWVLFVNRYRETSSTKAPHPGLGEEIGTKHMWDKQRNLRSTKPLLLYC